MTTQHGLAVTKICLLLASALAFVSASHPTYGAPIDDFTPAMTADRGIMWGLEGEKGHHQEVGFNGEVYFMIAQANAGDNVAKWGEVDCAVDSPGDQLKVFIASKIDGRWEPRGGSIESARITPCDGVEFPLPTTWGVGSLWHHDGVWYLTVDAGHAFGLYPNLIKPPACSSNADAFKHFVYLIRSNDGINWEPISRDNLIIDASNVDVSLAQRVLYTTVIPTSHRRVGFFFWTRTGCGFPARIGYGQIEPYPGSYPDKVDRPKQADVYLLRADGQYVLLPKDGRVDFNLMQLDLPRNPRPGDAYLTSGLQGHLLTHYARIQEGLFSCNEEFIDSKQNPKVWELDWTPFSLTDLEDPRLVLVNGQLPVNQLYPIAQGPDSAFNPRNAIFRDPDLFVDKDGQTYLFASGDTNCSYEDNPKKKATEKIHLYELATPADVTYSDTFDRPDEGTLVGLLLESHLPLEGHHHTYWSAYNMQIFNSKARPGSTDSGARADIAIDAAGALEVTVEARMIAKSPDRTLYLGFPNRETGRFGSFGSTLWLQVDSDGIWWIRNRYGGITYSLASGILPGWDPTKRHDYKLVYRPGTPKRVSFYFQSSSIPVVADLQVPKPVNLDRAGFQFTSDVSANLDPLQADADDFRVTVQR